MQAIDTAGLDPGAIEDFVHGSTVATNAVLERERAAVLDLVRRTLGEGRYEAAALLFLHAYANPDHERMVAAIIRELAPSLPVTCSSDVTREFREYERASTTALAAYVQPVMAGYVRRFSAALGRRGFAGRFSIMQSNGRRMPAEAMAATPSRRSSRAPRRE